MPLVKGNKAINDLPVGIIATERGSMAVQGLAMTAKNVELVDEGTNRVRTAVRKAERVAGCHKNK